MPAVKTTSTVLLMCLALVAAGCGDDDSSPTSADTRSSDSISVQSGAEAANRTKPKVFVPEGSPPQSLVEEDVIEGSGPAAKAGDEVTVNYVGVGFDTGKEFDASWNRNEPFSFTLGASEVIPGWEQGVEGMRVGGRRKLVIPANLAYGETGSPPVIGPNETLEFVIDLLEVK
jgi:peptidylprolyl isomerase